jgi:hypothetical protein
VLLDVLVYNVAAGHNIPSAVTELRRMWVDLQIRDARGKVLFRNPGLDNTAIRGPGPSPSEPLPAIVRARRLSGPGK